MFTVPSPLKTPGTFVSLGEVMIRDTPVDNERLERTRNVQISTAGSEFSVAIGLSRLGIGSRFVTRLPDNPYGRLVESIARENGVDASHFVWAPRTDLIGRYLYEPGLTPRAGVGVYQRKFSAASAMEASSVSWGDALKDARLLHISGISLGLSSHSGYETNYLEECFRAAAKAKVSEALVGFDFNYRGTLWSPEQMRTTIERAVVDCADILITTVEDLAAFFGIGFGKFSAEEIVKGAPYDFSKDELATYGKQVSKLFGLKVLALTKRRSDSMELNRWKSAAVTSTGEVAVSKEERTFTVRDRLGGGDSWASGFYFGLLTEGSLSDGIEKGIKIGDAAISFQQTLFFDLPIFRSSDLEPLLDGPSFRVQR